MEKTWTLEEICYLCDGAQHGSRSEGITSFAYDSRRALADSSVLFIAIPGISRDGHEFIEGLYRRGVRAFLVSKLPDTESMPEAGFCLVENTLTALAALAKARRRSFDGMVVGITGSNGKTIVKEWIYQLLGQDLRMHRSPKSFNSQLGLPLSVLMIQEEHEVAVIEAGISKPGEMQVLQEAVAPEIGVFTNLGPAHQENFSSMEEKLDEKLKLFQACKKLIFRKDGQYGAMISRGMKDSDCEMVSWSTEGDALYRYRLEAGEGTTGVEASGPMGSLGFVLNFRDEASLENALHALTLAFELGLKSRDAGERILQLEPVSMRLEILEGIHGSILINDAYNADIAGLSAALDLLNQQKGRERKILILSDLLQSGIEEESLYQEVAGLARQKGITDFIGIGPGLMRQGKFFPEGSLFYPGAREFMENSDPGIFRGAAVLIKGSRRFGFERITSELQLKTHQTRLEIDMNAMVQNLNTFRSMLETGTGIMVMVKALSYGSGSVEIARLLQDQKVEYLAVAYIDEGMELRKAGIQLPIMVMNPAPDAYAQMIEYQLEPEIYSRSGLESLLSELHYRQIRSYPVHLKIDTGMHRLGFEPGGVRDLLSLLKRREIRVASVFSHLAASGEELHDEFSTGQIETFTRAADILSGALDMEITRHILNSGGIERFPEARFQMVRLGIGLHGIGNSRSLLPVAHFVTSVSQVKTVKKGETVGYSRSGRAGKDMKIATLPVGYADGLDRRLGNGTGFVFVSGQRAPLIGNICMDMAMADVSGLDVREGDEVEIFGRNIGVGEVAELAGTIPYEILTSVPERVKRIYLQE